MTNEMIDRCEKCRFFNKHSETHDYGYCQRESPRQDYLKNPKQKNNGYSGDEFIIADPKNIRSTKAQFDPAKKNSANLLAGGASAAVGVNALVDKNNNALAR